jgi:TRAP-type C4-dicarboxylate transport system permease small subunit
MKIDSIAKWVERVAAPPNKWLHWIAMIFLLSLMFITVGDVVGRYMAGIIPGFGPIPGTYELTELMLAIAVLTAIGHTQMLSGHISIDLVITKFPPRVRTVVDCTTNFLSLVIFVLLTWQTIKYAHLLYISNDVSAILRLPMYPFLIVTAIGCFMFCLAMLSTFIQSLIKAIRK